MVWHRLCLTMLLVRMFESSHPSYATCCLSTHSPRAHSLLPHPAPEASPEASRRGVPSSGQKKSVAVGSAYKAPPPSSLSWGAQVPTSPTAAATEGTTPAPYPVGESMEQAVQFLTESLRSERKRSDELEIRRQQLEAANAALRDELRAAQDKVTNARPTLSLANSSLCPLCASVHFFPHLRLFALVV